jgi:hypothetical protein
MHTGYWWKRQKVTTGKKDNIRMDVRDTDGMIWIVFVWIQIKASGEVLWSPRVPQSAVKLSSCTSGGFSRRAELKVGR